MYGVKATASINNTWGIEGNFSYINHFESRFSPTPLDQTFGIMPKTVHGLVYDINGVLDLGPRRVFGSRFSPYLTAGVGGLSTLVQNGSAAIIGGQFYATDPATAAVVLDNGHRVIVADHTPFFSVNYGGGLRASNLWGPVGVRADIRARTFPNFRGSSMTWPEASAGLTFTFGER